MQRRQAILKKTAVIQPLSNSNTHNIAQSSEAEAQKENTISPDQTRHPVIKSIIRSTSNPHNVCFRRNDRSVSIPQKNSLLQPLIRLNRSEQMDDEPAASDFEAFTKHQPEVEQHSTQPRSILKNHEAPPPNAVYDENADADQDFFKAYQKKSILKKEQIPQSVVHQQPLKIKKLAAIRMDRIRQHHKPADNTSDNGEQIQPAESESYQSNNLNTIQRLDFDGYKQITAQQIPIQEEEQQYTAHKNEAVHNLIQNEEEEDMQVEYERNATDDGGRFSDGDIFDDKPKQPTPIAHLGDSGDRDDQFQLEEDQ